MPIYVKHEPDNKMIADLASGDWELPSQVDVLERWLVENEGKLSPSSYIADIGFSMRKNALGGGAILTVRAMSIMSKLGIKLYLSEYPDE